MKRSLTDKQMAMAVGAVLVGGYFVSTAAARAGKTVANYLLTDAVNLTSEKNIAHTAVGAVVGHENLDNGLNIVFARATLVNPWASEQAKREARSYIGVYS